MYDFFVASDWPTRIGGLKMKYLGNGYHILHENGIFVLIDRTGERRAFKLRRVAVEWARLCPNGLTSRDAA